MVLAAPAGISRGVDLGRPPPRALVDAIRANSLSTAKIRSLRSGDARPASAGVDAPRSRLVGRMSVQSCSMWSRHAVRPGYAVNRSPAGPSAKACYRMMCCFSSLTNTKKSKLSTSNGLMLTASAVRLVETSRRDGKPLGFGRILKKSGSSRCDLPELQKQPRFRCLRPLYASEI